MPPGTIWVVWGSTPIQPQMCLSSSGVSIFQGAVQEHVWEYLQAGATPPKKTGVRWELFMLKGGIKNTGCCLHIPAFSDGVAIATIRLGRN